MGYVMRDIFSEERLVSDYLDSFERLRKDTKNIYITQDFFSLKDLKDLIVKLEPHQILHIRREEKQDYKTIFHSKDYAVLFDGRLSSGYRGTGSYAMASILEALGVSEHEIEMYIYSPGEDNTVIQILKI